MYSILQAQMRKCMVVWPILSLHKIIQRGALYTLFKRGTISLYSGDATNNKEGRFVAHESWHFGAPR
jgi:hypothetical protein